MEPTTPLTDIHGKMRRKDREIKDRAEIDAILFSGKVMCLALAHNNRPFAVPLFYYYDGKALYFHSAKSGSKMEILKSNNEVCFVISQDQGIIESDAACDFEAKHRTVIGTGHAVPVEEPEKKTDILNHIVARFSDRKFDYPAAQFDKTAITQIIIDSIKGKKHGF